MAEGGRCVGAGYGWRERSHTPRARCSRAVCLYHDRYGGGGGRNTPTPPPPPPVVAPLTARRLPPPRRVFRSVCTEYEKQSVRLARPPRSRRVRRVSVISFARRRISRDSKTVCITPVVSSAYSPYDFRRVRSKKRVKKQTHIPNLHATYVNDMLTCRVQYVDDTDPFEYSANVPEPQRSPPVHSFSLTLPLINQIAGVHRALRAPHRVSNFTRRSYAIFKASPQGRIG